MSAPATPQNGQAPDTAHNAIGALNAKTRQRQRMLLLGGGGAVAMVGLWFVLGGSPHHTSAAPDAPQRIETDGIVNRDLSQKEFVAIYGNRLVLRNVGQTAMLPPFLEMEIASKTLWSSGHQTRPGRVIETRSTAPLPRAHDPTSRAGRLGLRPTRRRPKHRVGKRVGSSKRRNAPRSGGLSETMLACRGRLIRVTLFSSSHEEKSPKRRLCISHSTLRTPLTGQAGIRGLRPSVK